MAYRVFFGGMGSYIDCPEQYVVQTVIVGGLVCWYGTPVHSLSVVGKGLRFWRISGISGDEASFRIS